VVVSPIVAAGTAVVADWTACQLWERGGARVTFAETGLSDDGTSEMFSANEVRFRGEMRAAFGFASARCCDRG
jgi:hypothetical protein